MMGCLRNCAAVWLGLLWPATWGFVPHSVEELLSSENFDHVVYESERTTVVKFHSKPHTLKEQNFQFVDWQKVGSYFNNSHTVRIAEVNCDEHFQLCKEHGVHVGWGKSHPVYKIYVPGLKKRTHTRDAIDDGKRYIGHVGYKNLIKMIKDEVGGVSRKCIFDTGENCTNGEKEYIEDFHWKSVDDLEDKIDALKHERLDLLEEKEQAVRDLDEKYHNDRDALTRKIKLLNKLLRHKGGTPKTGVQHLCDPITKIDCTEEEVKLIDEVDEYDHGDMDKRILEVRMERVDLDRALPVAKQELEENLELDKMVFTRRIQFLNKYMKHKRRKERQEL